MARAWPGVDLLVPASLPPVEAGVSERVGGCRGRGVVVGVVAPGQAGRVGPAVPVVALPALPARHLVVVGVEAVVAVVVLEGRGAQRPAVVLPLRLSQQFLLQNCIVPMCPY